MTCQPFKTGGASGFVCFGGPGRRCSACRKRPARKLCDFEIAPGTGIAGAKTCDKPLCTACAVVVGDDRDHCPAHGTSPQQARFSGL